MAKIKLTKEQEQELKYLQSNNEMLEKTKNEAKLRGTESAVKRIELAQQDVIEQIKKIDPSLAKKLSKGTEESDNISLPFENAMSEDDKSIFYYLDDNKNEEHIEDETSTSNANDADIVNEDITVNDDISFNNVDSDVQYDVISLPSNGECYKNKMSRVPVGYLTAYDENFITSPNLYKDGLIIDFLLKHKIMNKDIKIDELCSGDADAIILFLRATSYGVEFPIVVRDPESGEEIDTVIDLSTIKYKEFTLKGDENGYFDYKLPVSNDVVKFKFLSRSDEKKLKMLSIIESESIKANTLINDFNEISNIVKLDKGLNGKDKQIYIKHIEEMNAWAKGLLEKRPLPFNKMITNRLEMSIISINGETDRNLISKYVKNMNVRDSLSLRKYMISNEPGVDFEIEVERPESLGGGSFKTFLEWDDTVFLNI